MVKTKNLIKFNDFTKEVKSYNQELERAIKRVLSSGWFILGKEVESFEEEFSSFLGSKYCIGVGNGLEALQISLMVLGIGVGDEVITTPLSAVATTLAILAVGATPVFVDTTSQGLIDADLIPEAITKRTKAILPVHLFGQSVDLAKIKNICKKNKLLLIEDACQAHGSTYQNKQLGTFGDLGCFSFYPTKNLGAFGDGGAIVTDNPNLAKLCREIRDYGQKGKYIHERYGLNSRLDEIQAAILRVKLKYLDKNNQIRRIIAQTYIENLNNISGIEILNTGLIKDNNYHLFVIKTKKRDMLQKYLLKCGIQTLIHYPIVIPKQPFLKDKYHIRNLDVARGLVKEILSLPCYPQLDKKEIIYISQKIVDFKALGEYNSASSI